MSTSSERMSSPRATRSSWAEERTSSHWRSRRDLWPKNGTPPPYRGISRLIPRAGGSRRGAPEPPCHARLPRAAAQRRHRCGAAVAEPASERRSSRPGAPAISVPEGPRRVRGSSSIRRPKGSGAERERSVDVAKVAEAGIVQQHVLDHERVLALGRLGEI